MRWASLRVTFVGTLFTATTNIPAFIIDGKLRVVLENMEMQHNQSGYTSSLLQIRESANTCRYKNLHFYDNGQFKGNAISVSNQSGSAVGIIKQRFSQIETYGFLNSVNIEITGNTGAYINGAVFSDSTFWFPKNYAVNNASTVAAEADWNNFINCEIQAQTSGGNQTAGGFNYDDTGVKHYYTTHVGVMVWDFNASANYADVNNTTQIITLGCIPSYKIGGSGAGTQRMKDYGYHGNGKGRLVFSGDGTTKDFTISHKGGGILSGM